MNMQQAKNNRYKNGEYNPNHSIRIAKDKAMSIEPSQKQVKFRDDLYRFCLEKGLMTERFRLSRTKQKVNANINAFKSILRKNGLDGEFFGTKENNDG